MGGDAGGPGFSSDGLTLYFHGRSNVLGGFGSFDLYQATRSASDQPFGNIMNLGSGVNSASLDAHAEVSADGLMLLFGSERGGGSGRADIYVATRSSTDDPFGTAVNFDDFFPGSDVNSNVEEIKPRLSSDGLTLFFSVFFFFGSPARPGGKGNDDIWVSTRDTTNDPFGTPVNLNDLWPGSEINTSSHELMPSLSHDWPAAGSTLYFTSNRIGGFGSEDIWQATWVPEPSSLVLVVLGFVGLLARRRRKS